MSVYDEISEKVGWFGVSDIPTIERARELLNQVMEQYDQQAFETVLKIHRFAPAPFTEDELIALDLICEAYKIGKLIFRNK